MSDREDGDNVLPYAPGEKRSYGKQTARDKHVQEMMLEVGKGNLDAALLHLNRAVNGTKRGPTSGAGALTLEQVEGFGRTGMTHIQIADVLGISTSTWTNWRKERPELETAYTQGKGWLAQNLKARMLVGAMNGDSRLLIFAGKNFADMVDKVEMGGRAPDQEVKITIRRDESQPTSPPKDDE